MLTLYTGRQKPQQWWTRAHTAGRLWAVLLAPAAVAVGPGPGKVFNPVTANTNLPVLTKAVQVRALSPQEASRGYPVRVRGVLTYCDPPSFRQFIQDDSAGIYLALNNNQSTTVELRSGQQVEAEGFSGPGDYAPIIFVQRVQVLGPGQFPAAKPTSLQLLMTGREDSQWVALRGVIRDQVPTTNGSSFVLATGEASIRLNLPPTAGSPTLTNLIDAAVEVRGVCSTLFSERRRLLSVELQVPGWEQLEVKEAPPSDPFTLPLRPISELFEFHAGDSGLHRARVRGTVTLCLADRSFFLQDDTGGILVQPRNAGQRLQVGQSVELVGFPAVSDKLPMLRDALVRPGAARAPVVPAQLDVEAPPSADHHATLVELNGRVLGHSVHGAEEWLSLQFGRQVVDVLLQKAPGPETLAGYVPGAVVQVHGVYIARLDDSRQARAFQVRLRSASDVGVVSRPSWWSASHTLWVLGGVATLLLLALAWARLLHKQVQQRTRELREEIEERKRAEQQLKETQGELMQASRLAGMGEVATSVLHNVGNVLNSANVSVSLLTEQLKASKQDGIARTAALLEQHRDHLAEFLIQDAKGRRLPEYLQQLAEHLAQERRSFLAELASLSQHMEHIKEIVAMQQDYARVVGVTEPVQVPALVEDALRMHAGALARHAVEIHRDYAPDLPTLTLDKHKVLQILVNLVHNAKYACEDSGRPDKRVSIRACNGEGRVKIAVCDNGVGIPPENLTRIFQHGFTTRKNGHGFGLHSGALAAKELGGALVAHSEGPGRGATFTLELPVTPKSAAGPQ